MAKMAKLGTLMKFEKNGKSWLSVALGQNKPGSEKYNYSVEIIVRDSNGKVVANQKDGFIKLQDPRKAPDELLAAGAISEEQADKMRERVPNIPDKVKYELFITT